MRSILNRRYRLMARGACLLMCLLLISGCGRGKGSGPGKGGTFVYYVNTEGTDLVKKSYQIEDAAIEKSIGDMLKTMQKEPDSIDYKSVFPKGIRVQSWVLTEESILDIHFNDKYASMKPEEELLLRAGVVQSLAQIHGVDYIDFYIEDEPLVDSVGEAIGYMNAENFLQYKGSSLHLYQLGNLKLYFANDKGDRLVQREVSIRYNSNMSIERLIVDQLIKGPSAEGIGPVIPPETKVIGVSVKDSVCYVNLDEGFLNNTYVTDPRITVYAIVNSIVDGGASSQVQISVNGDSNIKYMGSVDLSKPLSRDLDLVGE